MRRFWLRTAPAIIAGLMWGSRTSAASIALPPLKDNTIFQESSDPATFSDGAGPQLYSGRIADRGGGVVRRALFEFDVAGNLPAGAIVTAASFQIHVSRAGGPGAKATHALYRLSADWGESTSVSLGGSGGPATGEDATWTNRFFNDTNSTWATPGGDFADIPSALADLSGPNNYTFSSSQLAADVESWLNTPAQNHGWILLGDETTLQSVKQIDSREGDPDSRPLLLITYSVPEPATGAVGGLLALCLSARRRPWVKRADSPSAPVSVIMRS